jgi:hypothetical protein
MLLARSTGTAPEAVAGLVGLQAQAAMAPFVGLWSRLENVRREDIAACFENRSIVKATMMRATLHLVTAEDYLRFRSTLQPVLSGAFQSVQKGRAEDLDVPPLLEAARSFLAESPRTFAGISRMATELVPGTDVGVMRYAVRTHIPLVQVPVPKAWSFPGNPQFTLAESWLGKSVPPGDHLEDLILRYLAAFGPASATDMQAWSGFSGLKERIEKMRPKLAVYRDENRRELFDHPDLSIEDPQTPAPERFLPEFDNVLLSYANRTRIVAEEHRREVYVPVLRVKPTILVDGFVAGTWKTEKARGTTTLVIAPFGRLPGPSRQALTEEGENLVRFIGYDSRNHEVRFDT